MRKFDPHRMFNKLNLCDRELLKKQSIAHHDGVSFMFDAFDRRFGINHFVSKSAFGVSGLEYFVSGKNELVDGDSYNVGKAT